MKKNVVFMYSCLIIGLIYFLWYFSSNTSEKKLKFHRVWKNTESILNLWLIFTKASFKGDLVTNFKELVHSLCSHTSKHLSFNIIADNSSINIANNILIAQNIHKSCSYNVTYYDKDECIRHIEDIVQVMTPYFSTAAGAYYSDPFYYMSLGLHRIAPKNQSKIILIDCDLVFKDDVVLLFKEFERFSSSNLFGLAYELSSVYRHALHLYRSRNNKTHLGDPIDISNVNESVSLFNEYRRFPGFNSGVVLLNLERIRHSSIYEKLLWNQTVSFLTEKYSFKGSLGDQDYYTLLNFDYPELFYKLPCGWNRQLCKWWKRVDEDNVFDEYFKCPPPVHVYHKNCHTPLLFR